MRCCNKKSYSICCQIIQYTYSNIHLCKVCLIIVISNHGPLCQKQICVDEKKQENVRKIVFLHLLQGVNCWMHGNTNRLQTEQSIDMTADFFENELENFNHIVSTVRNVCLFVNINFTMCYNHVLYIKFIIISILSTNSSA